MKFTLPFESITIHDVAKVGGKNASLGEMINNLEPKGVLIPSGFAITADAYNHFIESNNLREAIKQELAGLDKFHIQSLERVGHSIRSMIKSAELPKDLVAAIQESYREMEARYGKNCDVAVRSSATAEDLPDASFAGQQETYLNICGEQDLIAATRNCFASLFTNRAISYRIDHGFDHMSIALSVGVQKMVRSDEACSGVIFTLDTESGHKDVVYITGGYGLGENVVQGTINPDECYVHKPTLKNGFAPILKKRVGTKQKRMVYAQDGKNSVTNIDVLESDRLRFCLSDHEILELAKQAVTIEEHYSAKKGSWCPMDIEWAKDGRDEKLYIVQARPETVHSQKQHLNTLHDYQLNDPVTASKNKVLAKGKSVGRKIATGSARIISSARMMDQVQPGEILVTDMTDPDWEPIMKIAGGIITNRGGRTCHAAIVSRELGIPAVVGTGNATETITNGEKITIDCSNGEVGTIYAGELGFSIQETKLDKLGKPSVGIMLNLGNPEEAFNLAQLPADGVGLARLEFIINNSIMIHPMALVNPDKVTDAKERALIDNITIEYANKKQFFVDKLAQEAGTIAAAFFPRPVIVRMSDFKSNEYRKLVAGNVFEPEEENPMIGFRGASRYHHPNYQEAFKLECAAMKKIRDEMGLTNVILMIPFVRTTSEANAVLKTMAECGLERGKNNLEIYMMCEIPSNVLLIENFSRFFDGFSIGSNDLTQMTLAVDRDSHLVSEIFDERNEAVKAMLSMAITGAKLANKKIGICGQGPSDYPELGDFLIDLGIDSISLNADAVLKEIKRLG